MIVYRKLGVDIEVLPNENGKMPTADRDPIIIISLSYEPAFNGRTTEVLAVRPHSTPDNGVSFFNTEGDMLFYFLQIVREFDPDIVCGYNSNEFDWPYIDDRIKLLGADDRFGKGDVSIMIRKQREDKTIVIMYGRVIIDLLPMVKKHANPTEIKGMKPLKQFSLGVVAHALLDIEKGDVKPSEMRALWLGPNYMKLIDYARRDAELNIALLNKLALLDRYIALAKASGCVLQDVINGGQTGLIDSLIIREFGKLSIIFAI